MRREQGIVLLKQAMGQRPFSHKLMVLLFLRLLIFLLLRLLNLMILRLIFYVNFRFVYEHLDVYKLLMLSVCFLAVVLLMDRLCKFP